MAQMKEQIKTPEKELSEMEVANLSDAEFKTLVVRMLRDLTEYSKCIREEMKATLREIKKNPLGTNREDKEDRAQSNNVEHMEEINSQPVQNEETRIQKNREIIRRLWDIYKHANIPKKKPEQEQKKNPNK